jgi:hypothetical protein
MLLSRRSISLLATAALAAFACSAVAAPAGSPIKRLGKTVVQHKDGNVRAVLSWRYANQTFEKEAWLLLELAFASEGPAVNLNREDVTLLTPSGERLPLPAQKRLAEGMDVRWVEKKASVARDPITDYFPSQRLEQGIPFFTYPGGPVVLDEIGGGPTMLSRGDIFFESPAGVWKPGAYTLVLKNKWMSVELPFTLPADDPKKAEKGADGKTVPW